MSRLDRLSIQGIRSFSPSGPEVIAFYPPVTLILGKNGSGKTTIIECLKYATTGDWPAGTNRGQSFIHDPKLTRSGTSRAVVKLQYYDERENLYCVSRTMEGTKHGTDVKIRSMDATISRVLPDGTLQSLKNKQLDLNTFITSTLGVSKAILNNVIFCHQEDSNWPLDEAKKVKDKFDDIFNTTRYVKCLDHIRSQMKETSMENKRRQQALEYSKKEKDEAELLRSEYQKQLQRKELLENEIRALEESKIPHKNTVENCEKKLREAQTLAEEIKRTEFSIGELERRKVDLQSTITKIVNSDPEKLEIAIKEFETTKMKRQIELGQSEEKSAALDAEIRKLSSMQQQKLVELGKLHSEEQQHGKRISSRDELLRSLAKQYDFPQRDRLSGGTLSNESVKEIADFLEATLKKDKAADAELKKKLEMEEKRLLEDLNKMRDDCVRKEAEIKAKEASLSTLMEEIGSVGRSLSDMDSFARQVVDLETEISKAEKKLEKSTKELDIDSLRVEIEQLKNEQNSRRVELDSMKEKLQRLRKENELRMELERTQKDLSGKKQQERRILSRPNVEEAIRVLVGEHEKEHLLQHYNAKLESLRKDINDQEAELKTLGNETASRETDIRHTRNQLDTKQKNLNDLEAKLKAAGVKNAEQLDSELKKLKQDMEKLEDERGSFFGSQKLYGYFIDKLQHEKDNPACPLCNREFSAPQESGDLIEELRDRIARMPQKIEEYDTKLTDKRQRHSMLLELRPAAESASKLSTDEIPQLKKRLEELEAEMESLKIKAQGLEEVKIMNLCEEDIGKKAQSDIVILDSTQNEIKKLHMLLEKQQKQLGPDTDTTQSLSEVQNQYDEEELALRSIATQLGEKQELLSKQQTALAALKEECNKLMEKKLKLTTHLQERESLKKRKSELEQSIEDLRAAVESAKELLTPAISKKMNAQASYEAALKTKAAQLEDSRKKMELLSNHQRDLSLLGKEIQRWEAEGKPQQLQREKSRLDELNTQLRDLENDKKAVQRQLENLKLALNNCEIEERNLKDNLKLISIDIDLTTLQLKLKELKGKYRIIEVNKISEERQKALEALSALNNQISEKGGAQKELQTNLNKLELQVKSDKCVNAEKTHQEKFYDYESHVAVAEDLSNFYNALNWALMELHRDRMNVINTLVREMWHNTYRGKDIEYIEVKAEDPDTSTSADRRRQYNYRVVMVKNGVEMDMRGRCSAGQKVLASLIIRMALAEAFSSKCGVLALDEPTTNLDDDNITSLCDTILQLAETISRTRRHFQLLIISHDERFLERMSRTARLDKFFRVERNRENQSQILEHDVRDGTKVRLTK